MHRAAVDECAFSRIHAVGRAVEVNRKMAGQAQNQFHRGAPMLGNCFMLISREVVVIKIYGERLLVEGENLLQILISLESER